MAYDAFISYRHGADDAVAAAIERGLERLARPWNRLRAMSVFRDESELGAAADLTGSIKRALGEAGYLVLLASPESAASPWVDKEVDHWCDEGGSSRLILVLTAGEFEWDDDAGAPTASSSAISPSVRARITTEPVYVDLRWARSARELSLRDSRFRAEIVRIGATIRGIAPADLESEDIRTHRHARRLARGAVAVVTVLAIVASVAAVAAVANARRADRRARDAVARQAGLAALDLPAADVDEAFLLSLAAADLDSDRSGEQFHASRVLVGRYARLGELRYAPAGTASVRDIAVSGDGDEIVAVATAADGLPVLLSWATSDRTAPTERALDPGSATLVGLDDDRLGVLGDASARLELHGCRRHGDELPDRRGRRRRRGRCGRDRGCRSARPARHGRRRRRGDEQPGAGVERRRLRDAPPSRRPTARSSYSTSRARRRVRRVRSTPSRPVRRTRSPS